MTFRGVTTSWDDGDSRDLRVADLLAKYGLQGTFYVCPHPPGGNALGTVDLGRLAARFELGAHTMSHADLTHVSLAQAREEISSSRNYIQDATGRPVDMFCFPRGHYTRSLADLVVEAGFAAGRTTDAFRSQAPLEGPLLHVSLQAFPHTRTTHLLHAVRHGNWKGLGSYRAHLFRNRWTDIATQDLEQVARDGGIWHLWGHSWEIDEFNLWKDLESILKLASSLREAPPLTNSQLVRSLRGTS